MLPRKTELFGSWEELVYSPPSYRAETSVSREYRLVVPVRIRGSQPKRGEHEQSSNSATAERFERPGQSRPSNTQHTRCSAME